jgi:hypothetical protein
MLLHLTAFISAPTDASLGCSMFRGPDDRGPFGGKLSPPREIAMADSNWPGYVGMVTGLFGAVMGYLGYRYAKSMKVLDLRLQLRKDESDFIACVESLPALLDLAKQSRIHVNAAIGLGRSGNEQIFLNAWEVDLQAMNTLKSKLPDPNRYYPTDPAALEAEIVVSHSFGSQASALKAKYQAELAADDKSRERIHAAMLAKVARSSPGPTA